MKHHKIYGSSLSINTYSNLIEDCWGYDKKKVYSTLALFPEVGDIALVSFKWNDYWGCFMNETINFIRKT